MKSLYTIAVIGAVILSSCSVYRHGQTPDDVYYSPAKVENGGNGAAAGYVPANSGRNEGRRYYNSNSPSYSGYDDYATMDDRWLMMRVRNPYRWSLFDDYNFYSPYNSFYSPYGFGSPWSPYSSLGYGFSPGWSFGLGFGAYNPYGFGFYNYYNNYWNWNSYFNPYYPHVVVVSPKTNPAGYNRARSFDLNRYNNTYNLNRGSIAPRYNNNNNSYRYNNSNNNSRVSSERYYNNNSSRERPSYSSPSQDRPVRSYTPSTPSYNSPRSSGSSSGGGGSVPSGGRPSRR